MLNSAHSSNDIVPQYLFRAIIVLSFNVKSYLKQTIHGHIPPEFPLNYWSAMLYPILYLITKSEFCSELFSCLPLYFNAFENFSEISSIPSFTNHFFKFVLEIAPYARNDFYISSFLANFIPQIPIEKQYIEIVHTFVIQSLSLQYFNDIQPSIIRNFSFIFKYLFLFSTHFHKEEIAFIIGINTLSLLNFIFNQSIALDVLPSLFSFLKWSIEEYPSEFIILAEICPETVPELKHKSWEEYIQSSRPLVDSSLKKFKEYHSSQLVHTLSTFFLTHLSSLPLELLNASIIQMNMTNIFSLIIYCLLNYNQSINYKTVPNFVCFFPTFILFSDAFPQNSLSALTPEGQFLQDCVLSFLRVFSHENLNLVIKEILTIISDNSLSLMVHFLPLFRALIEENKPSVFVSAFCKVPFGSINLIENQEVKNCIVVFYQIISTIAPIEAFSSYSFLDIFTSTSLIPIYQDLFYPSIKEAFEQLKYRSFDTGEQAGIGLIMHISIIIHQAFVDPSITDLTLKLVTDLSNAISHFSSNLIMSIIDQQILQGLIKLVVKQFKNEFYYVTLKIIQNICFIYPHFIEILNKPSFPVFEKMKFDNTNDLDSHLTPEIISILKSLILNENIPFINETDHCSTDYSKYLIRNRYALRYLLDIVKNTRYELDVIQFLQILANSSSYNTFECFKNDVTLYAIGRLDIPELVEPALGLFRTISASFFSLLTFKRVLSQMHVDEHGFRSEKQIFITQSLLSLIEKNVPFPVSSYFHFNGLHNGIFDVELSPSFMNGNITLTSYIRIDKQSDSQSNIMPIISFIGNSFYQLYYLKHHFVFLYKIGSKSYSHKFSRDIRPNRWEKIILVISKNQVELKEQFGEVFHFSEQVIFDRPVQIMLGSCHSQFFSGEIGPVFLFGDIEYNTIINEFSAAILQNSRPAHAILGFCPWKVTQLQIRDVFTEGDFFPFIGSAVPIRTGINNILSEQTIFSSLLPQFLLMNHPFSPNSKPTIEDTLFVNLLRLLAYVLSSTDKSETKFDSIGGFKLLVGIFTFIHPSLFSEGVIDELLIIFHQLLSSNLKKQMMEFIWLNFEFWSDKSISVQKKYYHELHKILAYDKGSEFDSYAYILFQAQSSIGKNDQGPKLFNRELSYYPGSHKPEVDLENLPQLSKDSIRLIKREQWNILSILLGSETTSTFLYISLLSCYHENDIIKLLSLLLMKDILSNPTKPILQLLSEFNNYIPLLSLLSSKIIEIQEIALKIIIKFANLERNKNLIITDQLNFQNSVIIMMDVIKNPTLESTLLLLDAINGFNNSEKFRYHYKELIPLFAISLLTLYFESGKSKDLQSQLIKSIHFEIKSSSEYNNIRSIPYWPYWIFIISFVLDNLEVPDAFNISGHNISTDQNLLDNRQNISIIGKKSIFDCIIDIIIDEKNIEDIQLLLIFFQFLELYFNCIYPCKHYLLLKIGFSEFYPIAIPYALFRYVWCGSSRPHLSTLNLDEMNNFLDGLISNKTQVLNHFCIVPESEDCESVSPSQIERDQHRALQNVLIERLQTHHQKILILNCLNLDGKEIIHLFSHPEDLGPISPKYNTASYQFINTILHNYFSIDPQLLSYIQSNYITQIEEKNINNLQNFLKTQEDRMFMVYLHNRKLASAFFNEYQMDIHSNSLDEQVEVFWRSVPSYDTIGRPMYMKLNKHYDQHLKAAGKRDNRNESRSANDALDDPNHDTSVVGSFKKFLGMNISFMSQDSENSKIEKSKKDNLAFSCILRKVSLIYSGTIKILSKSVVFIGQQNSDTITQIFNQNPEKNYDESEQSSFRKKATTFQKIVEMPLTDIIFIFTRMYLHEDIGCEIFMNNNKSHLIAFTKTEDREKFFKTIKQAMSTIESIRNLNPRTIEGKIRKKLGTPIQEIPSSEIIQRIKLVESWQNQAISTYQYIYALNVLSGRSFNDLSQYPVFPWVLCDYESSSIDLTDPKVYRDLSKPIGALNQDRIEQLRTLMNEIEDPLSKCLYRTHYSTPASVIGFLIRLEPFTTMHIQLQGGCFDHPDRIFHSIPSAWYSISGSSNDYRELIPEFFSNPTFLNNSNHLNLGIKQGGLSIDDVILPPWAENSSNFVQINRAALESDYVSLHIHKWIDLTFGINRKNLEIDSFFHPFSYSDCYSVLSKEIEGNPDIISIIQNHWINFGVCPEAIFTQNHPIRFVSNLSISKSFSVPSQINTDSYHKINSSSTLHKKSSSLSQFDLSDLGGFEGEPLLFENMCLITSKFICINLETFPPPIIQLPKKIPLDSRMIFSSIHKFLFSTPKEGTFIQVWKLNIPQNSNSHTADFMTEVTTLKHEGTQIGRMVLLHDQLATCGADSSIIIWSLPNFKQLYSFQMISASVQAMDADETLGVVTIIDYEHRVTTYCWITQRRIHSFQLSCAQTNSKGVRHHICLCNCGLIAVSSDENDFSEIELFDFYGKSYAKSKLPGRIQKMVSTCSALFENFIIVGTSWNTIFVLSCQGLKIVKKTSESVNGEFFSFGINNGQILSIRQSKPFKTLTIFNY